MNAVEIEEAVEQLVAQPFDRAEFPFQFLTAFGNKNTTVQRLRSGSSNSSDVTGGVLQRNNIHIATCAAGAVEETLAALRSSPKTEAQKAKFILVTDGDLVQAEDLASGEPLTCDYGKLHERFAFFLPLAGISTVSEIKNNPIDIKATGRLNKLYVELLKDNPEWGTPDKRPALNQFMARLIFCFFAEDTGIFQDGLFTATVAQMSHAGHGSGEERWGNTHEVLSELFRAMDTDIRHEGRLDNRHRRAVGIRSWADVFPYVNGGLFTGNVECPKFSRIARSYLLRAGELNWREINPDIFGSMIQAVADDDERGELGMHYTSVPNILKVLKPLFLDDLREHLESAGDNVRKLRNLRKRIGNIRVFDPACGSGNFLVIAYLKMREIEHEIVQRIGDEPRSVIKLSNFYGIEIKSFAVEIARLSLLIAEFQADCRFISQQEARAMVLPLHQTGQIRVDNALCVDWTQVCQAATIKGALETDLAGPTGRLNLDDEHQGPVETYLCGNPPYQGSVNQTAEQKRDMAKVFAGESVKFKDLDYVASWFICAARYLTAVQGSSAAFVATNSVTQGEQVAMLWPPVFGRNIRIHFAYRSFVWANSAANNAVVKCVILGLAPDGGHAALFDGDERRQVDSISPYLIAAGETIVSKRTTPLSTDLPAMVGGNQASDGGKLILSREEADRLIADDSRLEKFLRKFVGSNEFINSIERRTIWIEDGDRSEALELPEIASRVESVKALRLAGRSKQSIDASRKPHRFVYAPHRPGRALLMPKVSSHKREYLQCGLFDESTVISDLARVIYDAPLWAMSILSSRIHRVWIATVCGKLGMDLRYSHTLGWNTFPLPKLTDQNKADLARRAEGILLAREQHFPKTIGELYDAENMPSELRQAHDSNDELLERIYIGRRFRNDTERLEKLFELYSRMTTDELNKGKRVA